MVRQAELGSRLHDDGGDGGQVADGDGGEEVVLDLVAEARAVEQLPERRAEVARRLDLGCCGVWVCVVCVHAARLHMW